MQVRQCASTVIQSGSRYEIEMPTLHCEAVIHVSGDRACGPRYVAFCRRSCVERCPRNPNTSIWILLYVSATLQRLQARGAAVVAKMTFERRHSRTWPWSMHPFA